MVDARPVAPARSRRRALLRSVGSGLTLGVVALGGCDSGPCFRLPEETYVQKTDAVDLYDPIVAATPIIDVHTHTFNGRYLPLRKIALGKRDSHWILSLLSDSAAAALASSIARAARLRELEEVTGPQPEPLSEAELRDIAAGAGADPDEFVTEPSVERTLRLANDAAAPRTGDVETSVTKILDELGLDAGERFLKLVMLEDGQHRARYRKAYGPRVQLIVSHLMDLAPTYNQRPSDGELLPVEDQILRAEFFQEQGDPNKVDQIYFVAFSPFREFWPEGVHHPGRSLEIVKDAVENHHAYGVKVYPPSGYRPTANETIPKPWSMFTSEPREQWEARYSNMDDAQLDETMDRLLDWCEREGIPVFAHCNTGEFQARGGYGTHLASPEYWAKALEAHPKLRFCFGHAGGSAFWFGDCDESFRRWGELVFELCTTYENVYCEIGIHDAIVDPRARANFVERLETLFSDEDSKVFKKKLLFGTDWYMPVAASPMSYLRGYRRALLALGREAYVDFFCRNALAYLDVDRRLKDSERPLSPAVRRALSAVQDELQRAERLLASDPE